MFALFTAGELCFLQSYAGDMEGMAAAGGDPSQAHLQLNITLACLLCFFPLYAGDMEGMAAAGGSRGQVNLQRLSFTSACFLPDFMQAIWRAWQQRVTAPARHLQR
jgi:hypothetical protein